MRGTPPTTAYDSLALQLGFTLLIVGVGCFGTVPAPYIGRLRTKLKHSKTKGIYKTMEKNDFLNHTLGPAQELIESLIADGAIDTTESSAHALSFGIRVAIQKHAKTYKEPQTALSIIGDLHTTAAICQYLGGITRQALNDRINNNAILRLKDGKGRNGYPAFQFANGAVDPSIQKIIQTLLNGGFNEWETALWLRSRSLMYDGLSALDYMKQSPEHYDEVLNHARGDVNTRHANL